MDIPFLQLSERWRLSYDKYQWILEKKFKRKDKIEWRGVSFISSEKRVLQRVLMEKGVEVSPGALHHLKRLPDTFKEWLKQHESIVGNPRRAA